MPINVLKTAFTGIVGTLCFILVLITIMAVIWPSRLPIETYKGILEVLGIPTLFGMIVQSFIHQKPEDIPNEKQTIVNKSSTVVTGDPTVIQSAGSDTTSKP